MALIDLLSPEGILSALRVNGKKQALQEMSERAAQVSGLPAREIFDALLQRERLGSTGVGDGIAIPHARNPIILHDVAPAIAVCYLAQPIDFAAIDGLPVQTLFVLLSPSVPVHLHLLSRLSFMLKHETFLRALADRALLPVILDAARSAEAGLEPPVTP